MWPWVRHWRDWAMREFWRFHRSTAVPQSLHLSWELAGLSVADGPVPWCAEAVVVEAIIRLPPSVGRSKDDFTLRLPGRPPARAEPLRRVEGADRYRAVFRLPPPGATV